MIGCLRRGPLLAMVALLSAAGPAGAARAKAAPRAARPIPIAAAVARDIPSGVHRRAAPRARVATAVPYLGGPVLTTSHTHLIFWLPAHSGLGFEPGYPALIETFLRQVAADSHRPSNIFGLTGQYTGNNGPAAYASSYAGAVTDTAPLPANGCDEPPPPSQGGDGPGWVLCVSDGQLQAELTRVVAAKRLPTRSNDIYFLVTPNGLADCFDAGPDSCALGGASNGGYCGYHEATSATGLLYAVIPYNAVANHCQSGNPRPNESPADPTISTLAHELAEIVTDPLGTAWVDVNQHEIADLCITSYGPSLDHSAGGAAFDELIHGGRYYIQELWSNADDQCLPAPRPDTVSFTAPGSVSGDRSLALAGQAIAARARIAAYQWSFGDRGTADGRLVSHAYTRAGRYTVRLRTTDSWGNWTFATRRIRVIVPAPPSTRITAAPARRTRAPLARFHFTSNAPVASYQCRVDGGAWTRCRSPFLTHRLGSGRHTFSVRARDSFGQLGRGPTAYQFTIL